MTTTPDDRGFETRAVHAGADPDPFTGAVVPPISLSTTFAQQGVGRHGGWEYSRSGNPTRAALEMCLASLEGARHGLAFASGMAAEDAVLRSLPRGSGIVLGGDAYGGTFRLIDKVYGASGHPWTAADLGDPERLDRQWPAGTAVVWAETPTNPALAIVDIAAVAEVAHAHGARLVVDNTFATPYLQQPLALGADVVVHSSTKYLGGHSDVVGGFVATDDDDLGYPTANVSVPGEVLLPADGIYAGWFRRADGSVHQAAISLGRRPTFYAEAHASLLEAHLLDFEGDLYGEHVAVRFVARLRGEVRFESVEALIEQIGRDCDDTRRVLSHN